LLFEFCHFPKEGNRFLAVDVEMPLCGWLKADHWSMFTVVCAVCSDDADVVEPVLVGIVAQHFADIFTAAFFALLPCAYIENPGGCMFLFAH
jgi:hypothetical protein